MATSSLKLLFLDVETTGLEAPRSGLIQLAGIIETDGRLSETFNFRVRPFAGDEISDEALRVTRVSRLDIAEHPPPEQVFLRFTNLLERYVDRYNRSDKFHVVAYNAAFDHSHLRSWFEKNGDRFFGSWFWHPPIDVMGLAAAALMKNRCTIGSFKLTSVAAAMGLPVDDAQAHDALYDIRLTRSLYHALLKHPIPRF